MKKLIFGCTLMLCGIVGGTGWLIAYASLVQPGAWSTLLNILPFIGFGRPDSWIVLLFYAVAAAGAVIAIRNLKEEK